jgi:type I restriction-modification system DNA methylase subunit
MEPLLEQNITIESIDSCLEHLTRKYHDLPETDRSRMSEQDVRDYFITPLLEALGWGIVDPRERAAEKHLPKRGFSDYELCLPIGPTDNEKYVPVLYVEAKKFGELFPLQKDLFGYDKRSEADLQAIEYADEYNRKRGEKIGWAILTNFEIFRLWDTRRGVLVESTEWFNELRRERTLQILYLLSWNQVVRDPGFSSLSSYRTLPEIDEKFLSKLNEWRESLASSIWKFIPNQARLGTSLQAQQFNLRDVVQRTLDRLIVIRTAEDRGLLPSSYRLQEMVKNYGGDSAVQLMLLKNIQNNTFKYFDQHYNSKLFGNHLADEMEVHNSPLRTIIEELCKASFSSMNADILGTTYEQYLGQTIEVDQSTSNPKLIPNLETRAAQGIYYTPRYIVQRIVDYSLGRYLYGTENGQPQGKLSPGQGRKTIKDIQDLSVLDPACGSGSFLIYAFDVLLDFYTAERKRLQFEIDSRLQEIIRTGIPRLAAEASHDPDILRLRSEQEMTRFAHARIVERHLYGVDLDPQAAEVASMNLLLKALTRDERLPRILGDNVKVGNSLISGLKLPCDISGMRSDTERLILIRKGIHEATLHASENGADRQREEANIERLEQEFRLLADALNEQANNALWKRNGDGWFDAYEGKRPFNWQIEFPELFSGTRTQGNGFSFVLGNPPYVGFHGFARDKDFFRKTYLTAFGKFDIYVPFVERGLSLTAQGGELSFICPSTFMKRGFGHKMRRFLLDHSSIESMHDFLHTKIFREALNYTCICVFRHEIPTHSHQITYSEGLLDAPARPYLQRKLGESPWVFRFGKEEELVERIALSASCKELGDPQLTQGISEGIVTGRNTVLLIHDMAVKEHGIERHFLKKSLRGEDVKRYDPEWGGYYVIYPYVLNRNRTEVVSEQELKKVSPNLHLYLSEHKTELEKRTYLKDGNKDWYEIWCPRDIRQLNCPKIVVPELADRSQFSFVGKDYFYVDTTCGITLSKDCPFDLWYLLGVLNSRPAEFLYRKTTVPKANGFLIYKTMFLSTLRVPIPMNETQKAATEKISQLAQKGQACSALIGNLDRIFDESLRATLPLLDATQQSFKSDYYDVPSFWKVRRVLRPDALSLTDSVASIRVQSAIISGVRGAAATPKLTISYEPVGRNGFQDLIELEPINEDFSIFLILAIRRYLAENGRKRLWKLKGRNASTRTVDNVLGSLVLPIWGLLHGSGDRNETNLRKISEVIRTVRSKVDGEINPSVLEASRNSIDQEIDEIVFDLYKMNPSERSLVANSISA